jgi:pimeloyl-ACP methyl ester carboxylesterase
VEGLTNLMSVLRSYANARLFGESYGEGPVRVVWLHGWGRRGGDFAAAAATVAAGGVASVALDLPGFGATPVPREPGGARHYAELIVPALEELAVDPLVLVGHSFGGTVATVVAATHPQLVRSLVLVGSPLLRTAGTSRSPLAYRATRWLNGHGVLSERRLERARQKYGSSDYRNAEGVMRAVLVASVNESYEAELTSLHAPVALVWGGEDREVPPQVARRAAEMISSEHSLRFLEGVGHLVPTEAPEELALAVERALA